MTISTTTNRVTYTGNGVTVDFSFPYAFFAKADLVVIETVIATGVQTTKALTTHYTIAGSVDVLGHYSSGGTVTALTAPASTVTWTIYRDPTATQTTDLVENDPMPAEAIEAALDYQTMLNQRTRDIATRSLQQPEGDSATIGRLPAKVDRVSKVAVYDSNGDPGATAAVSLNLTPVSTFMQTVLDDTAAPAARATLAAEPASYVATVGGTADAITLTPTEAIAAYADGQRFRFIAWGTNTGPVTVAVSGLAAKNVVRAHHDSGSASSLALGDISTGQLIEIMYRNGAFQLTPYQHPVWANWPTPPSVGGSATYTTNSGTYIRHGQMVQFEMTLSINTLGTGSPIQISNFPVTAIGFNVFPVYWNGAASAIVTCVGVLGSTTLTLYSLTAAGATLTSANNILQNGTTIYISGSYIGFS